MFLKYDIYDSWVEMVKKKSKMKLGFKIVELTN